MVMKVILARNIMIDALGSLLADDFKSHEDSMKTAKGVKKRGNRRRGTG